MISKNVFRALISSVVVWASVTGCECGNDGLKLRVGAPQFVLGAGAEVSLSSVAEYDFGVVVVGDSRPLTMTIRNVGEGPVKLLSAQWLEGDAISISPQPVAPAPFAVDFEETELSAAGERSFRLWFAPPEAKGAHLARVALSVEGAAPDAAPLVFVLKAQSQRATCAVPAVLDFGAVPVGETVVLSLQTENVTDQPVTAFIGDRAGADPAAFGLTMASPRGEVRVEPGASVRAEVTFSPTELRRYQATIQVKAPGPCPVVEVRLRGTGTDEAFSWRPAELDFGFVNPGRTAQKAVVFVNPSNVPVTLTELTLSDPAFRREVAAGEDPTRFVVPGAGNVSLLPITCAPTTSGARLGTLRFKTGLRRTPEGQVTLKCTGGGPQVRVTPTMLNFGRVPAVAGSTLFSTRTLRVENVGSRPMPANALGNLHLGKVAAGGGVGVPPYIEVIAGAGTTADEIAVTVDARYDSRVGLEATAGRNFTTFEVKLTPKTAGSKAAQLVVHSNDPTEPEVRVPLVAEAVAAPPCAYQLQPAQLDFGLSTAMQRELSFSVKNLGVSAPEICFLTGLGLEATGDPAYSLPDGPISERELLPQEVVTVRVRFTAPVAPQSTLTSFLSAVQFAISAPATPFVRVPLRAHRGPSCLVATPSPLEFGEVKLTCASDSRSVSFYNACSEPLTIHSVTLASAAGLAPGAPLCPGAAACPEFFLTQTPILPTSGLQLAPAAAPVTVQVRYRPIDLGSDQGLLALESTQGTERVTVLVPLSGRSSATGQQADTFTRSATPQSDILFVVDDSCSMGDKLRSLADNFDTFIDTAVDAGVDVHLGVTSTTEWLPPCTPTMCSGVSQAPGGRLYRTATTPPVMTLANGPEFKAAIRALGISGSAREQGLYAAVTALTPPRSLIENVGFLRDDASLAVVVVADSGDQSPQPFSYYLSRLLSVKGPARRAELTFSNIGPYRNDIGVYGASDGGCSYDPDHDPTTYQSMTTSLAGVTGEICSADWASSLDSIGRNAFGRRTRHFLSTTPELGAPMQVLLDGAPVPNGEWSYDAASNSIVVTASAAPGAGQVLAVQYQAVCH